MTKPFPASNRTCIAIPDLGAPVPGQAAGDPRRGEHAASVGPASESPVLCQSGACNGAGCLIPRNLGFLRA